MRIDVRRIQQTLCVSAYCVTAFQLRFDNLLARHEKLTTETLRLRVRSLQFFTL